MMPAARRSAMRRQRRVHVSAYDDLGRQLVSSIEVLHMCDRLAALRVVRTILPRDTDLEEFCTSLEAVGAGALARDLRESRKRRRKAERG